jgi:hypothetical protein
MPPQVKNLAFYETAAQVIPILFVVLALELRYFEPWTWPQSRPDSWVGGHGWQTLFLRSYCWA